LGRSYGNIFARIAAGLTALAHTRAPLVRWGVLAVLAVVWIWAGYTGWVAAIADDPKLTEADALYRTLGALGVQDSLAPAPSPLLSVPRFPSRARSAPRSARDGRSRGRGSPSSLPGPTSPAC